MSRLALLLLLALAACGQAAAPSRLPAGYVSPLEEPGFAAFCAAHPGRGTCP